MCDACGIDALECSTQNGGGSRQVAVSGTHVAIVADFEIRILDGLTPVTKGDISNARGIVGTPSGWLVATMDRLVPLALDGAQGLLQPRPASEDVSMTFDGNRALLAWPEGNRVSFAVTDASGLSLVAPTDLFEAPLAASATTNGMHFFVGGAGQLARIASTGTRTIGTGFPTQPSELVHVTWSDATGWYVSSAGTNIVVQKFDATGAMVGAAITLTLNGATLLDAVADGNDLIAFVVTPGQKLLVHRIDPTGAATVGDEAGVGDVTSPHLVRLGGDILASWERPSKLQLVRVAP
jgi:hypothetical protein